MNYINNMNEKQHISLNIAHIFVHLFEIGGGESYLSNFCKYNDNIKSSLYINSNYNNKTLFNFNINTITYDSYEELNTYLLNNNINNNYDLIIDHQLYWFDFNYSIIAFKNIDPIKIIRITHGVPIHTKNITPLNYHYSIELYTDKQSNNSWNNHIKIYNDIGVNIDNINTHLIYDKIKVFENKYNDNNSKINVAIIGRINEEKIPIKFLKCLLQFLNKPNSNNTKYIFNFYGSIDNSYQLFMKLNHPNIIYKNIIEPNNISNVYKTNDILLHPSKNEAGATVILEAMSYGLPIISRLVGGIPNALNNIEYLCNTENEMFNKLLNINNINYKDLAYQNYNKILKYNNLHVQINKLYNELEIINKINNSINIPNIIHYIYGFEVQKTEFPFVYYLSILSNIKVNNPDKIYFHYQHLPYGYWWDKIKDYVSLNYINADNLYWGKKKINKYAHKADKIRLELLYKYGGVYMDIDTISYRSYKELLKHDIIFGIQEENYGKDKITLYCNALLFSKKNSPFIKLWMDNYENYFDNNSWCESSIHLLSKLISNNFNDLNNKYNITILEKETFYSPSYNETNKIFEDCNILISDKLITLHYWNSYSNKYYNTIKDFNYIKNNNTLYCNLAKQLLDYE